MIGQPRRYPPLSAVLADQLAAIESCCGYFPVTDSLSDGSARDRVYLAEASNWIARWGVWPDEDHGKGEVCITDVVAIADSPSRLPAQFANALYQAGESGMGYTIFTVQFRDGSEMAVVTGNALDFVDYPPGQSETTVVGVLPHIGRNNPARRNGPDNTWCLFGLESASGSLEN
jgi:hypothetical protein